MCVFYAFAGAGLRTKVLCIYLITSGPAIKSQYDTFEKFLFMFALLNFSLSKYCLGGQHIFVCVGITNKDVVMLRDDSVK